tara:strand:- start:1954 stop:2172 length:219 start_codon:yes stop_codon:yes gene_type:complete
MGRQSKVSTPSRTSPKGGRRGCLCRDRDAYSIECCNGDIIAQGIGSTTQTDRYLLQEDNSFLLQENNRKIVL